MNKEITSLGQGKMDELIDEIMWDGLSLNDKCIRLQSLLIEANLSTYGTVMAYTRPRNVFRLKRPKQARKDAERKEKSLSLVKINRILNMHLFRSMQNSSEFELC